ncbi:UdgX family uracil-DNA binding protein [Hyphomicrobium sp. CS1GBMeth3]|uniref:UdgX family uracil-DNA binding protein n=1 Tax=Hyphomicrobium sp. CS1GBMeth3 TaxID=1892845 RepID=UPI0009303FF2|nr:UdgX family uracil-DNA binding protein [Hyphomicrobium sp. CS1GBMeth3]
MTQAAAALARIRLEALGCERCPLYRNATQTVFGEGPVPASVMLVGEQPGDREDIEGHPFVGPAGRVLDKALAAAGFDRTDVYVTNAVKHFKNEPRGKRRLHKRLTAGEIDVCKVWLESEIKLVRPKAIVALGASAARALLGRPAGIEALRGKTLAFGEAQSLFVTIHPSLLLRMPDRASREEGFERFVQDLARVVSAIRSSETRKASRRVTLRNSAQPAGFSVR